MTLKINIYGGHKSSPGPCWSVADYIRNFTPVIRVVLIGSGNVAYHLCGALAHASGVELLEIRARSPRALEGFDPGVPRAGLGEPLPETDLILLAVSDSAVGPVSRELEPGNYLVAHCSGALPPDAMQVAGRRGVFYPLQTFSKGRPLDFDGVPVLLEAPHPEDFRMLRGLASALGGIPHQADGPARLRVHLAAVFANNFANHMACIGERMVRDAGLDPGLLRPLIRETADKLGDLPAAEAQTGPARRGDENTLALHRELLGSDPVRAIYDLLTQSIRDTYETEL